MNDYLATRPEDLRDLNDADLAQRHLDALQVLGFSKGRDDIDEVLTTLLEQDERCLRAELERRRGNHHNAHWPELAPLKLEASDTTKWIIDQMLPAGTASLLVAKPKVGKSVLATQAALAVARGLPFL